MMPIPPTNYLPDTENPLRKLRNQLGLTQHDLGQSLDPPITRGAVLRYEQGLYEHPSDRIVAFLAHATGTPQTTIIHDYLAWQRHQRSYYADAFNFALGAVMGHRARWDGGAEETFVPYEIFLHATMSAVGLAYSRVGFAKLLAIHPDTVAKFEEGVMTDSFRAALLDALPPYKVDYLKAMMK